MSDQGYPGQGGDPAQQPGYGQPQYPPPQHGQQPQYPPPQYPPPQHGQPPYGQPQYPQQPQYGPPQYGPPGDTAQWGAVPPQYPGYPVPGAAGGGGRNKGLIATVAAVVVAGVVVLIMFVAGVFSGAAAASPREQVKKLLDAVKTNDVNAAKKVLCAADQSEADSLRQGGRIKEYQIVSVRQTGDTADVKVTVTTDLLSTPTPVTIKTVKEGGTWKACPTLTGISGSGSASAPSAFPSGSVPSISNLPSIPAGGTLNACGSTGSAQAAATAYVGMAEIGYTDYAQMCVYKDTVPKATTASIKSVGTTTLYSPTGSSGNTFDFTSIDGKSHLSVTVSKESDGSYYITRVDKS